MSENFLSGIVRILAADGKGPAGTGFVVSTDGLIATCAHVIGGPQSGPIIVIFQATGKKGEAEVIQEWWRSRDDEDIAFLRIQGDLPPGVTPLPLGSAMGVENHEIRTFGFPRLGSIEGLLGSGRAIGLGSKIQEGQQLLQLRSSEITPGFSGAPVWDTTRQCVIGMVVIVATPDPYGKLGETAFATPTETLRKVCSVLQLSEVCPYRSLNTFTEADAKFFFGRRRVVETMLESLRDEPRFLAVFGPSGSGKSSVVLAGLIPNLKQAALPGSDRWQIIVSRPTDQSFQKNLKALDQDVKERKVMIIDQFEELFVTFSEEECQSIIAHLTAFLSVPTPLTIILTMRDDFYSRFVRYEAFAEPLRRALVNIPPTITSEEVLDIVKEPAHILGLRFEQGLAEAIVRDALESISRPTGRINAASSTVLPLLEFALTQLWERRTDGTLTYLAYKAIGSVAGSLAQWADREFYSLNQEQRIITRRVFTDLVHLGDEGLGLPDSRQRRSLLSLVRKDNEQEIVRSVVLQLANARLLVTSRDDRNNIEVVEIIHDALLREWGLLKEWIKEDRRFLTWYQKFKGRLQEWQETYVDDVVQRDKDKLLRGRDLSEAEDWLNERAGGLSNEEQSFIRLSREQSKREEEQLRALLEESERRRQEAERQREIALARQLAAQAEVVRNQLPDLLYRSVLLAVEAMRRYPSAEADHTLRQGLSLLLRPVVYMACEKPVVTVLFSPDGRFLATTSGNYQDARWVWVWEVSSGQQVARLAHKGNVEAVAFSPDGSYLATGSQDGTASVWQIRNGRKVMRKTHEQVVKSVAFSPDGRYLATASADTAWIWEVPSGQKVAHLTKEATGSVEDVIFSPDGRYLAMAGTNVQLWEISSRRPVAFMIQAVNIGVGNHPRRKIVIFSPDGCYLARRSENDILLWEVPTDQLVARMAHDYVINDMVFSPDGHYLATAGEDYIAKVWEVPSGRQVAHMAHNYQIFTVDFSPDGRFLATAGWDYTARVWEAMSGREVARIGDQGDINAAVFSPDGRYLATAGWGYAARVWRVDSGHKTKLMRYGEAVSEVNFSPDGQYLATRGSGGAQVWEVTSGQRVADISNQGVRKVASAFSRDSHYLYAILSGQDTIIVREAIRNQEVVPIPNEVTVKNIFISSDGRYLAAISADKTTQVWELPSGRRIARITYKSDMYSIIISPNGRHLVSSESNEIFWLWDVLSGRKITRITRESIFDKIVFSSDGHYLAGFSDAYDKPCIIWVREVTSGKEVVSISYNARVNAIAFSPDGRYLATASEDGTARLWEVTRGQEIMSMPHESVLYALSYSPDGRYLATASFGNLAQVWEVENGREVARMTHESAVYTVAYSPDGRRLATGSQDGTAQVWLLHPEDLIAEACVRLTRNLTQEEWHHYLGDEPYRKTCPYLS